MLFQEKLIKLLSFKSQQFLIEFIVNVEIYYELFAYLVDGRHLAQLVIRTDAHASQAARVCRALSVSSSTISGALLSVKK